MIRKPKLLSALPAVCIVASSFLIASPQSVFADAIGPLTPQKRAIEARKLRTDEAQSNFLETLPEHPNNGDEIAFPDFINNYTKGLPHDEYGVVDPDAYAALIKALTSGDDADFDAVPLGAGSDLGQLKFRNPHAAYSYLMEGKDPHSYAMPAAPAFNSAYQASEAIEVLWQAITRDVSYSDYDSSVLIEDAVDDMSDMSDFRGPKDANGDVTTSTLFRGVGPGETVGPYISQFLLKPIPYGATTVEQKYKVPVAGNDHMTNYDEWLRIQKGGNPSGITTVVFQDQLKYLYNGRAMGQFVLKDFVNMGYLGAARIIGGFKSYTDENGQKVTVYGDNDPYAGSPTQARSPLFGTNHAIDLLSRVSMGSQNVAWFQKWLVHRRARPEVYFGRIHNHMTNPDISYDIHADALESPALGIVATKPGGEGTYLLPTATPKGSPLHPTYPAGHAVMAGAAVTMLKAFYNGDFIISNPVMPSQDGTALSPYTGPALTIDGELNKLASNISLGRDIAGVHYRGDGDLGMALGEEYAISVLEEIVQTYSEDFAGFTLNKFDGTQIVISKTR